MPTTTAIWSPDSTTSETLETTEAVSLQDQRNALGRPIRAERVRNRCYAEFVAPWGPIFALYRDGAGFLRGKLALNWRTAVIVTFATFMVLDCLTTIYMVRAGSSFGEANPLASWGQAHLSMVGYNFTASCIEMALMIPVLAGRGPRIPTIMTLKIITAGAVMAKVLVVSSNFILLSGVVYQIHL